MALGKGLRLNLRTISEGVKGYYSNVVVPYCVEWTHGIEALEPMRRKVAADPCGVVLDIGFGSGLNLSHYPKRVTRVFAVDPSARARKLAEPRIAALHCPVDFVDFDAASIQARDASADCALSTFTLCTIPIVDGALAR